MMRVVTWLVCLLAVAVAIYGFQLSARAKPLSRVVEAKKAELQRANEREHRKTQLQDQTRRLAVLRDRFIRQLGTWLRDCESRDDFLIREGPWIVASQLKKDKSRGFRMAFYLPEGRHVLKYVTDELYSDHQGDTQRDGRHQNSAVPDDVIAVNLGDCPEVFELQVICSERRDATTMRMRILGKHNATIVDRTFTFPRYTMLSRCIVNERSCYLAYPGELAAHTSGGFIIQNAAQIDLLSTVVVGGPPEQPRRWIWIESEASPCLSALTAACHFDRTSMARLHEPSWVSVRIDEFFEPYDHSGRHALRSDLFRHGPLHHDFR